MSNYTHYESGYQPQGFALPNITWAVRTLIFANVSVFAIQLLLHIPFGDYPGETPGGNPTWWFSFQPMLWWCIWKPFTYTFLHSGLMHLIFNMMWLYFFGPEVERTLGSRGFLKFYAICGAVGVLLTLPNYIIAINPGNVPIVGASGAIMAVLVAFAMIDPDRQFFMFPLPFPITARGLVVIVVIMNLIQAMGNSNVSVETHFGGMAAGYLYIKFLPKVLKQYRTHLNKKTDIKVNPEKVGEAVDNIFDMKDWRKK